MGHHRRPGVHGWRRRGVVVLEATRGLGFDEAAPALGGRWNGAGFDAATSSLFASYGGQDATSTAGGSFGFLVTAGLDLHPEFTLVDPLDGVYLASFTASSAGYATSESFYVLFNLGESEIDHDEAIEWVEANLVPAPGALALLAAGVLVGRRRR